jgi:predicted  nucleic acid-binding Zn-ribbon protein
MNHRAIGSAVTVAGVLALAVTAAAQSTEGVKQTERLVKASENTIKAIAETKVQLSKTLEVYNALMADGAEDRKKQYGDLQKEMDNTEKRRAKIGEEVVKMDAEADALFKQWADSAAAIENPDLRRRSEQRLRARRAGQAAIKAEGEKAQGLYERFMKDLQDQVTFLGHDLNPSAVRSLEPEAAKINKRAEALMRSIDETVAIANAKTDTLRPE